MVNMITLVRILGDDKIEKLSIELLDYSHREFIEVCTIEAIRKLYGEGFSTKEISDYIGLKRSIIEAIL